MLSNLETMEKLEKQPVSNHNDRDIFDRMKAGELFRLDDAISKGVGNCYPYN